MAMPLYGRYDVIKVIQNLGDNDDVDMLQIYYFCMSRILSATHAIHI